MPLSRTRITDAETFRAVAHPLRMRLLGALRLEGPATASELGRRLGESSGATSYHLRQLERFGFVEDDTAASSRRERRWRASADLTSWEPGDVGDGGPETVEATRVVQAVQAGHLAEGVASWHTDRDGWSTAWQDAAGLSDVSLRLRPDQVQALRAELMAVVERYADQQRPVDDGDAARVDLHLVAVPRRDGSLPGTP